MRFFPSVIFEITDKCNLNCVFCYEKYRRKNKDIDLEVFKKAIYKYKPLLIQLTGGEPTFHNNFNEILKYALQKVLVVQFTTNGWNLEEKIPLIIKLKKKPIIAISLDFPSTLHNIIRKRNGLFEKIISNIKLLKKYKIPVALSTTIFGSGIIKELPQGNLPFSSKLLKFAEDKKIAINFQPTSPTTEKLRIALGKFLLNSNSKYIANTFAYRNLLINGHKGKCKYNLTNISLNTNGEILPTFHNDCYFCNDCLKCYYSCVWEPSLLTSVQGLSSANYYLKTYLSML